MTYLRANHVDMLEDITNNDRKVKGELEESIRNALDTFSKDFV